MFPEYGCSNPVVSIESEQSCFSLELNGIHLSMHRSCIIHSSSDRLPDCFHPLATVNRAAMSTAEKLPP